MNLKRANSFALADSICSVKEFNSPLTEPTNTFIRIRRVNSLNCSFFVLNFENLLLFELYTVKRHNLLNF